MADFNKTMLIGNLVQDPEAKDMGNGKKVTNFTIAINRKWKGPQGEEGSEVSYIDCSAFGKTGETIHTYFSKGRRIFIDGRLKQDKWKDKETQKNQSKIKVIVENFHFMDSKKTTETVETIPAAAGNDTEDLLSDSDFDTI
jgi:single-strand DNA-binding protein